MCQLIPKERVWKLAMFWSQIRFAAGVTQWILRGMLGGCEPRLCVVVHFHHGCHGRRQHRARSKIAKSLLLRDGRSWLVFYFFME